ncbi:MAG: DUF6293 family protein [Candidatus Nitrosotenuis sp.]
MSNLSTLRVHIAPVGFEIDRVVMPAKEMKADKVWLLVHEKPSEDKAGSYIEKIQKQLQREKIRVVKEYHDRLDLFNIIKSVKRIIESEQKNTLYVNLASGSKIQAIACMMACMMFNENNRIIPFYAEAERYSGFEGKQMSYGVKNLMQIPAYQIHTPRPELILALKIIRDHGGKITKKQMADIAERDHLITVNAREENLTQARFASLDKNIIQPLENQWKFVRVEKIGRNRWIELTEDGINASEFLI